MNRLVNRRANQLGILRINPHGYQRDSLLGILRGNPPGVRLCFLQESHPVHLRPALPISHLVNRLVSRRANLRLALPISHLFKCRANQMNFRLVNPLFGRLVS